MKRIFAIGFLAMALVACSHTEEAEKGEEVSFKQVEATEEKKSMSVEYEDYLKFSQEYSHKYHEMNTKVTEHFKSAEEKPSLMFDEDWIAKLKEYESIAHTVYSEWLQKGLNGEVPDVFKEVHAMTESAYEHKYLSLEAYIEGLEAEDQNKLKKALIYAEASNQKMSKAVEMLNEVVNEVENIH